MEGGYRRQWWPVCNFLLASAACYILRLPLFPAVRSSWPWDLLLVRLCEYNNAETWDFLRNLPFLLFTYQCVSVSVLRMVCGGSGVAYRFSDIFFIESKNTARLIKLFGIESACAMCCEVWWLQDMSLTSLVMLSTSAFMHFKEYKETNSPETLEETVSASVTLLDGMMTDVAHTHLVEEKITAAIKNTIDFGWIHSSGYLLHHQETVDCNVRSVTRISIPWWCKRRNRSLMEASRQRATRRKLKILSHTWFSWKVMPLCFHV